MVHHTDEKYSANIPPGQTVGRWHLSMVRKYCIGTVEVDRLFRLIKDMLAVSVCKVVLCILLTVWKCHCFYVSNLFELVL